MTKLNAEQAHEIANQKASRRACKKQPKMKVSGTGVKKLQRLIIRKSKTK